jgi:hypothetical protein
VLTVIAGGQLLEDNATVASGTEIVFGYDVSGADYLYLLQRGGGETLTLLYPASGLAWLSAESGVGQVTPADPNARFGDEPVAPWSPQQGGELEFILIASPTPRDVASDAKTSEAVFLLPPPYVKGPAAGVAKVLDRVTITFADDEPALPGGSPEPPR